LDGGNGLKQVAFYFIDANSPDEPSIKKLFFPENFAKVVREDYGFDFKAGLLNLLEHADSLRKDELFRRAA
jgi:hypothetical protein